MGLGRAIRGIRAAVAPGPSNARPPLPGRDRTIVAAGRPGAFAGLDAAVSALVPDGGPYRLNLLAKLYEHDRRFHVVTGKDWDLAFYAPEGAGFHPHCDVHGHLERAFDAVAGMAEFAVMAEWGTDPVLPARLSLLAEAGAPFPGMPSLALSCAQLARYVREPFETGTRGTGGAASMAYGGAVVMFAVGDGPTAAAASLRDEVSAFSRTRARLHPLGHSPGDVIVADMSEGFVATLAGDIERVSPRAEPRF